MRKVWAALSVVALVGCAHGSSAVEEHASAWERRVAAELPQGTGRAEVEAWARKNSIVLSNDGPEKQRGVLEILPGDGLVCSKWHTELRLTYDPPEHLRIAKVEKLGVCL